MDMPLTNEPVSIIQELKDLLLVKGWPNGCQVNRWGSCQYFNAVQSYDLYFQINNKLLDVGYKPQEARELTLDILNLKVLPSNYPNCRDLSQNIRHFNDIYSSILSGILDDVIESYNDGDLNTFKYKAKWLYKISKANNIDEIFNAFRISSFDLWKCVPIVTNECFVGFDLQNIPSAPGYGPIGNQEVQSVNYYIGICCALLVDYGLVKNDHCFWGFDT